MANYRCRRAWVHARRRLAGGAKLVVRANTPIEEYVGYARRLTGIKEEVPEVGRKKA